MNDNLTSAEVIRDNGRTGYPARPDIILINR